MTLQPVVDGLLAHRGWRRPCAYGWRPAQACTQTHFISGLTSQWPFCAHAAAGPVAQVLRAIHRAGHAGRGQRALAAHLAVEEEALDLPLDGGDGLLQPLIADALQHRGQHHQAGLEHVVEALEAAGMTHGEEADGIHGLGSALPFVIPAKAGIQGQRRVLQPWIPAFAGMTERSHDHAARRFFSRPDSAMASAMDCSWRGAMRWAPATPSISASSCSSSTQILRPSAR